MSDEEPPDGLCEWASEQVEFAGAMDARWEHAALGRRCFPVTSCIRLSAARKQPVISLACALVQLDEYEWSCGTVWLGRCPDCRTIYWDTEYRREYVKSRIEATFERIKKLEALGHKVDVELVIGRTHVKSRRSYAQRFDENGTYTFVIKIDGGARDSEAFED